MTLSAVQTNYKSLPEASPISSVNRSPKVGAVAQAALKNNRSGIDLRNLNREQLKNYVLAMLCRGLKKGILTVTEKARTSFGPLAGVQLSGLLKGHTQTSFIDWVSLNVWDLHDTLSYSNFLPTEAAPSLSFKTDLDAYLKIGVDALTYASAVAWFIGHSITPRIERFLSSKEDVLMGRVLRSEVEIPKPKLSTTASKISHLIDYVMPVLFDATQVALFIRYIRNIGNSFSFWPNISRTLTLGDGDLNFNAIFKLWEVNIEMLNGDDPVSDTTLYLLLAAGIVLYAVQAWCNFHHDLQVKKAEVEVEEVPSDDFEGVVSASSSN